MTPIEKQILENQSYLLGGLQCLLELNGFKEMPKRFTMRIKETRELLNSKKEEEPCCEMPEEDLE